MIERERGPTSDADEAIRGDADEVHVVGQSETVPAPVADDEEARHARFLEALDHVMSKHHNVLAALAK